MERLSRIIKNWNSLMYSDQRERKIIERFCRHAVFEPDIKKFISKRETITDLGGMYLKLEWDKCINIHSDSMKCVLVIVEASYFAPDVEEPVFMIVTHMGRTFARQHELEFIDDNNDNSGDPSK